MLLKTTYLTLTFVLAVSSWAQQSPSPAPPTPQAQSKPAPCVSSSVIPKRVHVGVPIWLQKQINKQAGKLGTTVDLGGMIADATTAKPCPPPPAALPAPAQPKVSTPPPAPSVTIRCNPLIADPKDSADHTRIAVLPDPHNYQSPTQMNPFEADNAEPDLGASTPCGSLRVDPKTKKYWLPAQTTAGQVVVSPAPSQPNQ